MEYLDLIPKTEHLFQKALYSLLFATFCSTNFQLCMYDFTFYLNKATSDESFLILSILLVSPLHFFFSVFGSQIRSQHVCQVLCHHHLSKQNDLGSCRREKNKIKGYFHRPSERFCNAAADAWQWSEGYLHLKHIQVFRHSKGLSEEEKVVRTRTFEIWLSFDQNGEADTANMKKSVLDAFKTFKM